MGTRRSADGESSSSWKRKESGAQLIRSLPAPERDFPVCTSYCFNWLLKGACKTQRCPYLHAKKQRSAGSGCSPGCAPDFAIADDFKRDCNPVLVEMSVILPDTRCFILGKNDEDAAVQGRQKAKDGKTYFYNHHSKP